MEMLRTTSKPTPMGRKRVLIASAATAVAVVLSAVLLVGRSWVPETKVVSVTLIPDKVELGAVGGNLTPDADVQSSGVCDKPGAGAPAGPGKWLPAETKIPPLPLMMGEVASGILELNGSPYLLVFGEHTGDDGEDEGKTAILDMNAGTWTLGAARPYPGHHHAAEVWQNKLYVLGGLDDAEGMLQVATLVDAGGGVDVQWEELEGPGMHGVNTGSANSALINGMMYYCGGIDDTIKDTIPDCVRYDPATQEYTPETPMLNGRNHAASCTDGESFMIVFGGREGKNSVTQGFPETQIFKPGGVGAPGTWEYGAELPLARGGTGKAVYYGGKCYVFGGEMSKDQMGEDEISANKINGEYAVYRVDVYDVATDTWTEGTDMPVGLHGMFPVLFCGEVIISGGGLKAGFGQSADGYLFEPAGTAK